MFPKPVPGVLKPERGNVLEHVVPRKFAPPVLWKFDPRCLGIPGFNVSSRIWSIKSRDVSRRNRSALSGVKTPCRGLRPEKFYCGVII